ncbi:hypothetical protein MMC28_003711 [Mycoblastus sanguinarius]|nr:hypothetical protein [Mycoblastus sanguinarius]
MVSFLQLPAEVRLQIYRDSFTSAPAKSTAINLSILKKQVHICQYGFPRALLLLNRKINDEAKSIFYSENIFKHVIFHDGYSHSNLFWRYRNNLPSLPTYYFLRTFHICLDLPADLSGGIASYMVGKLTDDCTILLRLPVLRLLQVSLNGSLAWYEWHDVYSAEPHLLPHRRSRLDSARGAYEHILTPLQLVQDTLSVEIGAVRIVPMGDRPMGDGASADDHEMLFSESFDKVVGKSRKIQ